MSLKKKIVSDAFKFMVAAGSLAGTLGIWKELANKDLVQASSVEPMPQTTDLQPLPTVVPLLTVEITPINENKTTATIREVTVETTVQSSPSSANNIAMDTEDEKLADELKKAGQWFEEWEQSLSRFRLNSELSILNRHPGMSKEMSEVFYFVMEAAIRAEELSGGLVTPFLLEPLLAAGYTEDFEMLVSLEQGNLKPSTLFPVEADRVEFDPLNRKICLPYGTHFHQW